MNYLHYFLKYNLNIKNMNISENNCLQCNRNVEELIMLYLQLKIRSTEEVSENIHQTNAVLFLQIIEMQNYPNKQQQERIDLINQNPNSSDLIEYIKTSVEVMMNLKVGSFIENAGNQIIMQQTQQTSLLLYQAEES